MPSFNQNHNFTHMRFMTLFLLLLTMPLFAQQESVFSEEEVSIELPEGILYGTLTMPAGAKKKTPIVMLIPGSGPTDRDCNSALGLKSNAFVMLAAGLAEQGIATLRIDKRISGKSASTFKASNEHLDFNDFIRDNERWIAWIRADKRFGKLTVCGHSQGALTGLMAAQHVRVDKYVSLCGAGKKADELMREQFIAMAPEQETAITQFFDTLMVGGYDMNAPLFLKMSIPQSLASFLATYSSYDPAAYIGKLSCPVLIVQGERDLQVPIEDAKLLHAAAPKSILEIIPEMNHVLKSAPEDRQGNIDTYNMSELPLKLELVPILSAFVRKR